MKTALVTGSAKRIGKTIAERLLEEDFNLILHANTSFSELEEWVASHPHKSRVMHLVQADLAHEEGQMALVAQVQKVVDKLDLLVHNASAFFRTPFADIDRACFRAMIGINLEAPFFITQGLLSTLLAAHAPCVINIIDAMWQRPNAEFSHYAASKAGLAVLTRALANEYAPHLRVNGVAPGAIMPASFHDSRATAEILSHVPYKRLGSPRDIADAIIYLSTAAYVSGEIIVVDGCRSIAR